MYIVVKYGKIVVVKRGDIEIVKLASRADSSSTGAGGVATAPVRGVGRIGLLAAACCTMPALVAGCPGLLAAACCAVPALVAGCPCMPGGLNALTPAWCDIVALGLGTLASSA